LTDPMLGSRATDLIYDSADVNRRAKLRELAGSDLALRNLRVCWRSGTDENCGRCEKCLRTMMTLELHGALDRCPTFPARRVDPLLLRRMQCADRLGFRRLRRMQAEAWMAGRHDLVRALTAAERRSARVDLIRWMLSLLGPAGERLGARVADRLGRGRIPA